MAMKNRGAGYAGSFLEGFFNSYMRTTEMKQREAEFAKQMEQREAEFTQQQKRQDVNSYLDMMGKFTGASTSPLGVGVGTIQVPQDKDAFYAPPMGDTFGGGWMKPREQPQSPKSPYSNIIETTIDDQFGYWGFKPEEGKWEFIGGAKPETKTDYVNRSVPGTNRMARYDLIKNEYVKDKDGNYIYTDEPDKPDKPKEKEDPYIGDLTRKITTAREMYGQISKRRLYGGQLEDADDDVKAENQKLELQQAEWEVDLIGSTDELAERMGVTNDVGLMWEAVNEGIDIEEAMRAISETRLKDGNPPLTPKQKQAIRTYFKVRNF